MEASEPITLLESSEAARLAGCSPDTIREAARRGDLPVVAVSGRIRLISPVALELWNAERKSRKGRSR
jgi:excisionase family DNA binding protein